METWYGPCFIHIANLFTHSERHIMKLTLKKLVLAAAIAFPVVAMAGPGLAGTAHDFTTAVATITGGPAPNGAATVGLCTYCHTPHSALSTSLLWNHNPSAVTAFSWDETATAGGTSYATAYKGPSVKCLSCHDGSVAIGDVALYNEKKPAALNNKVISGMYQIGAGGVMNGNHPIAMPYPYQGAQNTYNGKTTGTNVVTGEFVAAPVANAFAMVKLYNDSTGLSGTISGGAAVGKSGIECSSCHDVHNKQSTEDFFLRGKMAGSTAADGYLCAQCHIK